MKFPLRALGDINVAGVQYRQGDVFDAINPGDMRYLIQARVAVAASLVTDEQPAEGVAVADKTPGGATPPKAGTQNGKSKSADQTPASKSRR